MLDKPFDCREINRRAVSLWGSLRSHLVGLDGRPVGDIIRLREDATIPEPGRARKPGGPQLREFRGPSPYEDNGGPGAWHDVGTGQSGPDVVSLLEYLSGGADRRTCADFLSRLCDRMVPVK
jgi:hypothetical protein